MALVVHDVLQGAFSRSCQQHSGNPSSAEVLSQPALISPLARVVDNNGVVDSPLCVVDARRVVRVEDLNWGAVCNDDVVVVVDGY